MVNCEETTKMGALVPTSSPKQIKKMMGTYYITSTYDSNSYPIGSMYGTYANIWGIFMVNVTIYTIHGYYWYLVNLTKSGMGFPSVSSE